MRQPPCVADLSSFVAVQEFLPEVLKLPFKAVVGDFLLAPWEATAAARSGTPTSQASHLLWEDYFACIKHVEGAPPLVSTMNAFPTQVLTFSRHLKALHCAQVGVLQSVWEFV
jgi:hypothetical protein